MYEERYECENCYSDINRQRGFKPKILIWRCESCGQQLVYKKSDDRYYNAYICYACNAVLNNQIDKYGSEFSTYEDKWKCRKCGCILEVDKVEDYSREEISSYILDECSEKLLNDNIFFCKYCGAVLNQQEDYDPLIYDKEYSYLNYYCEKCGNEINKEDIKYTGREINNKYFCHRCGALLNVDSNFYDEDNYQCYVCGYVHNNYIDYGYDEDDDYDKYNFDDEEGYDEYEEDEDYNEYDNGVDYNKYYEDNNYNNHTTNNYTYNEFNINYKRHTGMDGIDCLDDIDDLDLDADSKDSNKHDIIKLIIITLNIWFLIGALIFLIIKLDDSKTMVKVPITQKGAEGIDYKKIEKKFKDAGFTNVIVKAQNDIVFGIFAKKNTVDYIEIDGSKKFEKNDRVEEDSEVVIYYHSK